MQTHPAQKTRIKSVETMFAIVDALKERYGATNTELSNQLDISKSTVHRHLVTLKNQGYVTQEGDKYRIGLQFLNMGVYARHQHRLYEASKDKIRELAEVTGEQAWCVVEEEGVGRYICGGSGKHRAAAKRVGQWSYLHQTASGKAILAHLSDDRIEEIIVRHGLPANTDQTITKRESLYEEINSIRERGIAFNREESLPRLHAVGAPVRHNQTGEVIGSISVAGPAHRLKGDTLEEELPEHLLGLTNEIEINLTYDKKG